MRPSAVSTSASAIPAETAPRPPEPVAAMPWNAVMMPTTVPSSPTNGAVDPMVASAETPFLRSDAVSAEALVDTALGLIVAIPAVWFYNYLTGRIEYFNVEMDNSSSELVDYFIKKTA